MNICIYKYINRWADNNKSGQRMIIVKASWMKIAKRIENGKQNKKEEKVSIKTFVIGPAAGRDWADRFPLETVLPLGLDLKAVIV